MSALKSFKEGFKQGYNSNKPSKPSTKTVKNPVVPPDAPKRKFKKRYAFIALIIALPISSVIVSQLSETPQERSARIALEQQQEAERIVSRCKSSLEFSMKWETKQRLRDPDSFEAGRILWLDGKKKDTYELVMNYRARNGFGGMNVGMTVASATASKDTCALDTINFPIS